MYIDNFGKLLLVSVLMLNSEVAESLAQAPLAVERSVIAHGNEKWDWLQVRTGYADRTPPICLTTMSLTGKEKTHDFHDIFLSVSTDHGENWSKPRAIPSLRRTKLDDGYEISAGDLWPKWHAATDKFLITGKTFDFEDGTREDRVKTKVSYAVIDPETLECGPLKFLELPDTDHEGRPLRAANAGCNQRVDLANGDVLLPIRYLKDVTKRNMTTTVVRCRFDGTTLTYLEHGSEHSLPTGRGLYEPSAVQLGDQFFLTMRADDGAYVSKSRDGLDYTDHIPWTFDDGTLLGSYNTQQHWVTLEDRLFLVYTRKGADNDHIMRHRAPLFIAEGDPEELHVIRSTEQVLVPENDATLGNSGVCQVSENEAWVTVGEGRVSRGKRSGEFNKVILAKIRVDDSE
ncbi:exo-alpha-sialidase [Thalassoglobus sp. JC818]|uniref:exo-alpha-sialidase n=1 Tax=Thalassoglobus sp. JC818 TaxID=3232136 RepID=UPI00345A23CD